MEQKPNEYIKNNPHYLLKFGGLIIIFLCCISLAFIILFSYYYVTLKNEIQSINNITTPQSINNITTSQSINNITTSIVSFTHNFTRLYNQTNSCDSSPLISLFPNNCI